jgi:hypothetical protein
MGPDVDAPVVEKEYRDGQNLPADTNDRLIELARR